MSLRQDYSQRSSSLIQEESLSDFPFLGQHNFSSRGTSTTRPTEQSQSAPSMVGSFDSEHAEIEVVRYHDRHGGGGDDDNNNISPVSDDDEAAIVIAEVPPASPLKEGKDVHCSVTSMATVKGSNLKKRNEPAGTSTPVQSFRQRCGTIVNNGIVQNIIIVLICINALMMGIETTDMVEENPNVSQAFETTDFIFLIIFTVELVMQFIYHGAKLFQDGWLVFDFFVIVLSWSFDSVQVVRSFRIFRTIRLVARLESLRKIINALAHVGPSMASVMFLFLLILYIFAVLCTELFWELELSDDYFGHLDESLFTLLEMMTLEWADIAREVMDHCSWAWAVFVPFLVITSFILFSLVVAVVCDAVTVTEKEEPPPVEKPGNDRLLPDKERVADLRDQVAALTRNQALVTKALREALAELESLRTNNDGDHEFPSNS